MRAPFFTSSFALTLATCLVSGRAHAIDEFPYKIRTYVDASYTPPCGICHEYGKTSGGAAHTPFAWAMRARGLDAGDRKSIDTALAQMSADQVDSDGDGVGDLDELKIGTDPNSAADASILPSPSPDPKLGCQAGAPSSPASVWSAFATLPLLGLVLQMRRTRRRSHALSSREVSR